VFRDEPLLLPENSDDETNWYDMRLTRDEDGWIYGTFCVEKKIPLRRSLTRPPRSHPAGSSARRTLSNGLGCRIS